MTEVVLTRKQSVVDELWQRANELITNYDGEPYGSTLCLNMNLNPLHLMTSEEFHGCVYDEDLEAIYAYIRIHTENHPKSPYRFYKESDFND
jgi:hypothetical protein